MLSIDRVKEALLAGSDDINGQVSSADLENLRAICRLYSVDMEPGGQISIYSLKMKDCRLVEKPKRAKLAQLRGRIVEILNPEEENPDYVFGIRGVSQIWPVEEGLHVALFEKILTIIPADKESFRWLSDAIYLDRMHLRAFGFKGDLLDIVGHVSPKKFTISLEGLEI